MPGLMMAAESGNETEMFDTYADHDGGAYFIGSGWPFVILHRNRDGSVNRVQGHPMYTKWTEARTAAKRAAVSHARYVMKCTCPTRPTTELCGCVESV